MDDEDIVAGVVVDGKARAYPLWILVAYHVVNATIGEAPVLFGSLRDLQRGLSLYACFGEV